jgi:misacylated tRNA(Ala) deacylase
MFSKAQFPLWARTCTARSIGSGATRSCATTPRYTWWLAPSTICIKLYKASVTGVAIYPNRARTDFSLEDVNRERVAAIEAEANRVIQEGRRILVRWISREKFEHAALVRLARNLVPSGPRRIRLIEIEGFDAQADSGTHVANTQEFGRLAITKTDNRGKFNRRVEFTLAPLQNVDSD